jgi:hypothetical protein
VNIGMLSSQNEFCRKMRIRMSMGTCRQKELVYFLEKINSMKEIIVRFL